MSKLSRVSERELVEVLHKSSIAAVSGAEVRCRRRSQLPSPSHESTNERASERAEVRKVRRPGARTSASLTRVKRRGRPRRATAECKLGQSTAARRVRVRA